MDYQGLTADDLLNINALNRSFLRAAAGSDSAAFGMLSARKMSLDEQARLASAPFLLFSLRERDDELWSRLLDDNPQAELVDQSARNCPEIGELQAASLGFLWQLARRNPYAVRLTCGASVHWCEGLARLTLVTLLRRSNYRHDLLRLRFADDARVWRRLLGNGVANSKRLRRASHHSALQEMLTRRKAPQSDRLPAAACAMPAPVRQTLRYSGGGIRKPKV